MPRYDDVQYGAPVHRASVRPLPYRVARFAFQRRAPFAMAEINVLVLDNGSDTIKAGYCLPERDPLLVRRSQGVSLALCGRAERSLTPRWRASGDAVGRAAGVGRRCPVGR